MKAKKSENAKPMVSLTVNLSRSQHKIFEVLAKGMGATPGEVMLALACDRLRANSLCGDRYAEMGELLWDFAHRRQSPEVDKDWLSDEDRKELGYAQRSHQSPLATISPLPVSRPAAARSA